MLRYNLIAFYNPGGSLSHLFISKATLSFGLSVRQSDDDANYFCED